MLDEINKSLSGSWTAGKEYVDLKVEDLKMEGAKAASSVLGTVVSIFIIVIVALMALGFLSLAGVFALGNLMGNYALAALSVAAIVIVLMVVLIFVCRKAFVNIFVRQLSRFENYEALVEGQRVSESRLNKAEADAVNSFETTAETVKYYCTPSNLVGHCFKDLFSIAPLRTIGKINFIDLAVLLLQRSLLKRKGKKV